MARAKAGETGKSRAHTLEEMQKLFIEHVHSIADYWANPNGIEVLDSEEYEKRRRLVEGGLFSLLVTLDGCSMELAEFKVIPNMGDGDKEFDISNGDNYYPEGVDIGGYLHELLGKYKPEKKEEQGT